PRPELHLSFPDTGRGRPFSLRMERRFFDPFAAIRHTRNHLPHWQQPGATYFITFRLADAVPAGLRTEWTNERAAWLK
ncbi:MAG: hypothetical protein ABMA01_24375, partial [Chthoniobacteraceae bacterium]